MKLSTSMRKKFRVSNKLKKVSDIGGTSAKSIKEVVSKAEIVITMLPATKEVLSVMLGENGLINILKTTVSSLI